MVASSSASGQQTAAVTVLGVGADKTDRTGDMTLGTPEGRIVRIAITVHADTGLKRVD